MATHPDVPRAAAGLNEEAATPAGRDRTETADPMLAVVAAPSATAPILSYCPRCGIKRPGGSQFCGQCGFDFAAADVPPTPSQIANRQKADQQPAPGGPTRRRWVPLALILFAGFAVIVSVAVLLGGGKGGGAGSDPLPAPQTAVDIGVAAPAGDPAYSPPSCGSEVFGTLYYSLPGTEVLVSNEAGATVGVGRVPTIGELVDRPVPFGPITEDCLFTFTIDLEGDAKFYTFDFGEYGDTTISVDELETQGWQLELEM